MELRSIVRSSSEDDSYLGNHHLNVKMIAVFLKEETSSGLELKETEDLDLISDDGRAQQLINCLFAFTEN
jgi:hypothetical protein